MLHQVLHRPFFALRPSPALARQMLTKVAGLDCRPMLPERVHLTLFILDDHAHLDSELIDRLRTIGGAVRTAPIGITLDRLAGSYRSVALRPAQAEPALLALHRDLARRAAAYGIAGRTGYRFSAHVTLAYDNPTPWSEAVAPIAWTADELVLFDSHVGATRHEPLGRWPLFAESDPQLSLL